jgi:hypothetical protein
VPEVERREKLEAVARDIAAGGGAAEVAVLDALMDLISSDAGDTPIAGYPVLGPGRVGSSTGGTQPGECAARNL